MKKSFICGIFMLGALNGALHGCENDPKNEILISTADLYLSEQNIYAQIHDEIVPIYSLKYVGDGKYSIAQEKELLFLKVCGKCGKVYDSDTKTKECPHKDKEQ